jgi:hypothetical protein
MVDSAFMNSKTLAYLEAGFAAPGGGTNNLPEGGFPVSILAHLEK